MSRDFNGTTSVVAVVRDGVFLGSNSAYPLTLAIWVQPDGLGESSSGRIIALDNAGGGTGVMRLAMLTPSTFETLIDFTNPGNVSAIATIGTVNTSGNVWQHLAMTWSGVANSVGACKLYVNAVEVAYASRGTSGGIYNSTTNNGLHIGNQGPNNGTFDGRLAHAHYFKRELSSNELRQLMHHSASLRSSGSVTGISPATAGLVGYWSLGGFSGNEPDYSGNYHVGTLTTVVLGSNEPPVNETFLVGYPMGAMAM